MIYSKFSLVELANSIFEFFRDEAKAKNIEFELLLKGFESDQLNVYNDEVRIKQILINLISNALKYTIKGKISIIIESSID